MRNILYYGGCWTTNIGNAFIDMGALHILKKVFPNDNIHFANEFVHWLNDRIKSKNSEYNKSFFDLVSNSDYDILVYSGMCMCDAFIEELGESIINASKDKKIIILGGGGLNYDNEEIKNYREFMKEIKPKVFISRDSISFENYNGIADYNYDGIECAFFLNKAFTPLKINKEYIVKNFDNMLVPNIKSKIKNIVETHHCYEFRQPKQYLENSELLISSVPNDYLNVYANAKEIYTDRVHTALSGLVFGSTVKLYSNSPRVSLFEKLDANLVTEELIKLDFSKLQKLQNNEIKFLKSIGEKL